MEVLDINRQRTVAVWGLSGCLMMGAEEEAKVCINSVVLMSLD